MRNFLISFFYIHQFDQLNYQLFSFEHSLLPAALHWVLGTALDGF